MTARTLECPPEIDDYVAAETVGRCESLGFTRAEGEAVHLATELISIALWYGVVSRVRAFEISDEIGCELRAVWLERSKV
jgi:hypothetical protein